MKRQIVSLVAAHIIKFICPMGSLVLVLKSLGRHSSKLEGWIGYLPMILVAIPCSLMYLFDTALFACGTADLWKRRMTIVLSVIAASIDVPMLFRFNVVTSTSEVVAKWSVFVVPQVAAFVCCCLMVDMLYKPQMRLYPPAILARLLAASVILGVAHWGWVPILAGLPAFGIAVSLICKVVFLFVQLMALNEVVPRGDSSDRRPAFDLRVMWYSTLMMSAVYCAFPLMSLGAFEAVRRIAQ